MTALGPRAHEYIAADAYWSDDIQQLPSVPSSSALKDEWSKHSDDVLDAIVYRHTLASYHGFTSEFVPQDETLPLLDIAERSVLKVVVDWRKIHGPIGRITKRGGLNAAEFDDLADDIARQGPYSGSEARYIIDRDESGRHLSIGRYASYYVTAPSGLELVGVMCQGVRKADHRSYGNVLPRLTVGASYGKPQDIYSVFSAEVVTPSSVAVVPEQRVAARAVRAARVASSFRALPGIA